MRTHLKSIQNLKILQYWIKVLELVHNKNKLC